MGVVDFRFPLFHRRSGLERMIGVAPKHPLHSTVEGRSDGLPYGLGARHPGQMAQLLSRTRQLETQPLNFLDEQQNRATSRSRFLRARFSQTLAPPPQRLELVFV